MTRPDAYPGDASSSIDARFIDSIKPDSAEQPVSNTGWDTPHPLTSPGDDHPQYEWDGMSAPPAPAGQTEVYRVETGSPGVAEEVRPVRRIGAAATAAERADATTRWATALEGEVTPNRAGDVSRRDQPRAQELRPASPREGEVVEGTIELPRRPAHEVIGEQRKIAIDGDDKLDQDREFGRAIQRRAEQLRPGEKALVIDFSDREVLPAYKDNGNRSYKVKVTTPLDAESPFSTISTDMKVDVVAATLTTAGAVAEALAKSTVLGKCVEALETWRAENPQPDGERGSGPVTVEHLRDAIGTLMEKPQSEPGDPGRQYNEIPSLLKDERVAIGDALGKDGKAYEGLYPQLHSVLSRAVKDDQAIGQALARLVAEIPTDEMPGMYDATISDEPKPVVHVVSLGPGVRTNIGRELLAALTSTASISMVDGMAFVAIRGLTEGHPTLLKMAVDKCTSKNRPIIVSDGATVAPELTDKWPRAILPVGTAAAGKMSQALGTTIRRDRTGVNITLGNSGGAGYKPTDLQRADSLNSGFSRSVSWTVSSGPGQRIRQPDIENGPGPGEMAITGTPRDDGIYDTRTGEWLRPFPSPELEIPEEVIHAVQGAPREAIEQARQTGRPLDPAVGMKAVSAFVNQDLAPPDVMKLEAAIRTPQQRTTHMNLVIADRQKQRVRVDGKVHTIAYSRENTILRICTAQHTKLLNVWRERYNKGQTGVPFKEWSRIQTGGLSLSPELTPEDKQRWREWWGV